LRNLKGIIYSKASTLDTLSAENLLFYPLLIKINCVSRSRHFYFDRSGAEPR